MLFSLGNWGGVVWEGHGVSKTWWEGGMAGGQWHGGNGGRLGWGHVNNHHLGNKVCPGWGKVTTSSRIAGKGIVGLSPVWHWMVGNQNTHQSMGRVGGGVWGYRIRLNLEYNCMLRNLSTMGVQNLSQKLPLACLPAKTHAQLFCRPSNFQPKIGTKLN